MSRLDLTSVPVSELSKLPARLTRLAANYCGLTVEATTALLTAVTRTSNTTTQLGIIRWVSCRQGDVKDVFYRPIDIHIYPHYPTITLTFSSLS